jgi:hypothetical protein
MKEIDITQWTQVGEGGKTYVNPAEPGVSARRIDTQPPTTSTKKGFPAETPGIPTITK